MALLFMDGFGHIEDGYDLAKWDYTTSNGPVYIAGRGVDGGYGMYFNRYVDGLGKILSTELQTIIVGFRLYNSKIFDSGYQFLDFKDNNTIQIEVRGNGDGSVSAYRGATLLGSSDIGKVSMGIWSYIEVKVAFSNTVGSIELRQNGTTILNITGVDTCSTANEYCSTVEITGCAYDGGDTRFDDLYICDTTGTENNDFLGDVTITTLYPTSDGNSSDFTPSTGVDNYATVDEPQLLDTSDYNTATVIGEKDTFGMTTLATTAPILAVQTVAAVNNLTTGTVNVRGISRSGSTPADNEGSDFTLSQTVKAAMDIFEKEPTDDVAWDVAKVNAAEFGIKVQS